MSFKKLLFFDVVRLYIIFTILLICYEIVHRREAQLTSHTNALETNLNHLQFNYKTKLEFKINESYSYKAFMKDFPNFKYKSYNRLVILPLNVTRDNRKQNSCPIEHAIEKNIDGSDMQHYSTSRILEYNRDLAMHFGSLGSSLDSTMVESRALNNSFFDLQMNVPESMPMVYNDENPIKSDIFLRNYHSNISTESKDVLSIQKFGKMDSVYKQDVDLGFTLPPMKMISKNVWRKREEDTEKVEAIQSLKDSNTAEMTYLQDLDLGYFLSSSYQSNLEASLDEDDGTDSKQFEKLKDSLPEVLENKTNDGWAGIPFKIDNETGEYIRLPLDELFQDVLPLSDNCSSDENISKPKAKNDSLRTSEFLDLSTDEVSSIMQSLWCPSDNDKNLVAENQPRAFMPERCKLVESELKSPLPKISNARMETRIQDIANLFSPVSGFCGINSDINSYPRYHTHFQTKNNSNLLPYASRQPPFYNIHREENSFHSNFPQHLESVGIAYPAGEFYNNYRNNSSADLCPNEGFLGQFLNEECMVDLSESEKTMPCQQEGNLPMGNLDTILSQSNKSIDISSSACTTNITERFDLSCDSAVSSLSSERVHSTSDGEWGEGSDSGQDYNHSSYYGPHDYSAGSRSLSSKTIPVAQKKHHLYGKRYYQEQSTESSIIHSTIQYLHSTNSETQCDKTPYYAENSAYNECAEELHHPCPNVKGYAKFNYSSVKSERDKCLLQRTRENLVKHNHTYTLVDNTLARESVESKYNAVEGHLTRDEKRARSLNVPIPVADIINLPMDEFNERISKFDLTENQLSLIRDIRRRGKNKVAAQNCRKRKLDQILSLEGEVKEVRRRKEKLNNDRACIAAEKKRIANKFAALHQHIFQFLRDDDGNPCSPSKYSLQQAPDGSVYLLLRDSSKVDCESHIPFLIESNETISSNDVSSHRRVAPSLHKSTLNSPTCQTITDRN